MSVSVKQESAIIQLLSEKLDSKLKKYSRETTSMPFLVKLMQDQEKVAAYSFIHSLVTTLGMSVYEQISLILVEDRCTECFRSYDIGGNISKPQKSAIDGIMRDLRNGTRKPDFNSEVVEVLAADPKDGKYQKEGTKVDFYMLRDGIENYFEIKTAKPNIDIFTKTKTKLLEWVARRRQPVKTFLALPYNPYHPEPYERFANQGFFSPRCDLLVGNEYWDFLSGENTYEELLEIFDRVGKEYKVRINQKIQEVAKTTMNF